MRSAQKVAFSLLISVAVFAAFTFLAYSGLFNYIESNFYYPRIRQAKELELEKTAEVIHEYIDLRMERFKPVVEEEFLLTSYLPNQSQENIYKTSTYLELLKREIPGFLFFRLTDMEGGIHYSTLEEDIVERQRYKIVYKSIDEAESGLSSMDLVLPEGENADYIIDSENQHLLFRIPVIDRAVDVQKGTGLFYVSGKDLTLYLLKKNRLEIGQDFGLLAVGYIINLDPAAYPDISETIVETWKNAVYSDQIIPIAEDEQGYTSYLLSHRIPDGDVVGLVLNESEFTLSMQLRILLLVAFGLTFFLIIFLVLSFRQDSMIVLSNRIKRFQADFLTQFVERREILDWEKWKEEVQGREQEVKNYIKKGIGKIKKEKSEEVDSLIDKSWHDLLALVGTRIDQTEKKRLEVENLEEIIQNAIEKAQQTIPKTVIAKEVIPAKRRASEELEEAEELEESEELEEVEERAGRSRRAGRS